MRKPAIGVILSRVARAFLGLVCFSSVADGQTLGDSTNILVATVRAINAKVSQPSRIHPRDHSIAIGQALHDSVIKGAEISEAPRSIDGVPCDRISLLTKRGCSFPDFESLIVLSTIEVTGGEAKVFGETYRNGPAAREPRRNAPPPDPDAFPVPSLGRFIAHLQRTDGEWRVLSQAPWIHSTVRKVPGYPPLQSPPLPPTRRPPRQPKVL
jgi:hypothetical protein